MISRSIRLLVGISLAVAVTFPSLAKRPGSGGSAVSHTAKQVGPIQLGTSGGWASDLANGYCCGGTLGSLIRFKSDGSLHVLSNFHVLAADVVDGDNGIVAMYGDPVLGQVIQPALIDVRCDRAQAQVVALLSGAADPLEETTSPTIDAAIAQVLPDAVDTNGAILEIGNIANETLPVNLVTPGLAVKKSGRTTGFTRSTIDIINATVSVTYEDECAGSVRGTATFTGQIVARNRGNSFLDSGDSGSLMVEDVDTTPRAVGLLFAGSSSYAIANPIDDVLNRFGAEMVGDNYISDGGSGGSGSGSGGGKGWGKPKGGSTGLDRAASVHRNNAGLLNAVEYSNGHGVSVDDRGKAYIAVLVESLSSAPRSVPSSIEGVPVRIIEVGRLVAY
jgi:hypothetical protein